jgi:hypothetical protein
MGASSFRTVRDSWRVGQAGAFIIMKAGGIATSRCTIADLSARACFDVSFSETQDHVPFIPFIHFIT